MLMLYSEGHRVKTPGNRVFLLEAHQPYLKVQLINKNLMIISGGSFVYSADLSKLG